MSRRRHIAIVICWLSCITPCAGQVDSSTRSDTEPVIELFNGRDLEGWVNVNGSAASWQVRDGVLIGGGHPRCFLRTESFWENYELELEWRITAEGGNSGLFVHADALPQIGAPYPRAFEAQIRDGDHGTMFAVRGAEMTPMSDPGTKGKTPAARPTELRCRPVGEWNKYQLKSLNGLLELSVNDQLVTRARAVSQVAGHIALQAEHHEVHYRGIRVRPLPSSNPDPARLAQRSVGFESLFDGLSFAGWNHRPGHQEHWTVHDGEIHYDGEASSKRRTDKDLWSRESFGDFTLVADWRLPSPPHVQQHPIVLPTGDFDRNAEGKRNTFPYLDAGDSGIYLRGSSKAQLNIWSQKLGSGEINGYRTDREMPPEVRLGCLPLTNADNDFGQWNRFVITMLGERVSVQLNGKRVIDRALLPGVPPDGPIGLQHHGDPVQFRNLFIKKPVPDTTVDSETDL